MGEVSSRTTTERAYIVAKAAETTTDLALITDPEEMVKAIKGELVPEIEDPEIVALRIMEGILSSETPEDVLGGTDAVHAQDVLDRPFTLNAIRVMRSRFEGGAGVFLVLEAEMGDDGENSLITCSSRNVMAQAVQLLRLDALPRKVKITQSETPTANGYYVLRLRAA